MLYDGTCGLCHRAVQFTLRHDHDDAFRFAPLQSEVAASILKRHDRDPSQVNTVVLVLDPQSPTERLLTRSDAALAVLARLGIRWRVIAALGRLCPRTLRDRLYDWVAHNRYRIFGRRDSCVLPAVDQSKKFLA
jgi:predicted DCC family thiol-disulfide oxidoreductase YuxK